MTSQTDLYQNFLDRMDRWITANKHKAVELFKRFDLNGDGVLTYDEFKSGKIEIEDRERKKYIGDRSRMELSTY